MDIAFVLILQMTGLYLCIGLGYYAARHLEVQGRGISSLLFYIIVPLVFMHGISKVQIQVHYLLLPACIFLVSCTLCLTNFALAKRVFTGKTPNILALASGNANMGYFGIPIALMLFEPEYVGIYMMTIIGIMLYETTLGYYITTKGDFSTAEAFKRMLKLPMLHGALIGVLLSVFNIAIPEFLEGFFVNMRGAYTILGMMVVGIGLAGVSSLKLDWKFTSMAFAVKFIAWPLAVGGLIWLDKTLFGLFDQNIYNTTILLSVMPLAVNSVIFANLLNAEPEKMATAVFLSTLFAMVYVPMMVHLFIL